MLAYCWRERELRLSLLCGEDIANKDFLNIGRLDASALNGS